MTSLRDRDAGRDYEGNGPSSFDPVSRRIAPADVAPLSPEKMAAFDAAVAQCERAFGKWDREQKRFVPQAVVRGIAA